MTTINKVRNVGDYIRYLGQTEQHPLVGIVDYAEASPIRHSLNNYSVYGLFMHENLPSDITYGCGKYDYRNGRLICVAPGQIGGKEDNGEQIYLDGWAILFHPDLLHDTPLGKNIRNYTFFDYNVNEALFMTPEEHDIFVSLMKQIKKELLGTHDKLLNAIIVDYISLLLNYCLRFYERQFMTRKIESSDVLKRFNRLLEEYYEQGIQLSMGIPSVHYCADQLCMSPGYLGDLIKKFTGSSAIGLIHQFIVQKAKNAIAGGDSMSKVAYDLGFEYPQHLSRMFKRQEGITPTEYYDRLKRK